MITTYRDETGREVRAHTYQDAANALYHQQFYPNPACRSDLPTVYAFKRKGCAEVMVYKVGDKQGTYWGREAAIPEKHTLTRIEKGAE